MLIMNHDRCKFLAALLKEKYKKLIAFQHGANIGLFNYSIQEEIEKKYCDKRFFWSQKTGIGSYFFLKYKENNNSISKR